MAQLRFDVEGFTSKTQTDKGADVFERFRLFKSLEKRLYEENKKLYDTNIVPQFKALQEFLNTRAAQLKIELEKEILQEREMLQRQLDHILGRDSTLPKVSKTKRKQSPPATKMMKPADKEERKQEAGEGADTKMQDELILFGNQNTADGNITPP